MISRFITPADLVSRINGKTTVVEKHIREITRTVGLDELHAMVHSFMASEFDLSPAETAVMVITPDYAYDDEYAMQRTFDGFTVTITQDITAAPERHPLDGCAVED